MAAEVKLVPAKIHADVMESARNVANMKGEHIQDLLSNILRPILAEMERELLDRRLEALGRPAPGSGKRPKGTPP
jgi:hypothetical protein